MTHVVVIGLGAGGFGALMAARHTDHDIDITVIEKRNYQLYSPCGIPFAIEGIIKDFDELKHEVPLKSMNIHSYLEHEVLRLEPNNKQIIVRDLNSDNEFPVKYDALIIATGANPYLPPIEGADRFLGNGVYTVRIIEDGKTIVEACAKAKKALIVGAGAIGLEIASGLKARGLETSIVEAKSHVLPLALDPVIASKVEKHLKSLGINVYTDQLLTKIEGGDRIEQAVIGDTKLPVDMVILSAGVRADWSLAKDAGITLGRWGILTDVVMRTNIPEIFAVGDVAETVSIITHRPTKMQLAGTAYKQGTVAGTVAAGGYMHYHGASNTWVSVVGGLEVAATGLNTFFAEQEGFKVISGQAMGQSRPQWYPGGKELTVRVLADAEDGLILGAQAVGLEAAAEKIEIVAMALRAKLTVHDLANAEMAYCPPVSEVIDPLTSAAQLAAAKLKPKKKTF
jgi:NADH oxidase (H2O2-forming)